MLPPAFFGTIRNENFPSDPIPASLPDLHDDDFGLDDSDFPRLGEAYVQKKVTRKASPSLMPPKTGKASEKVEKKVGEEGKEEGGEEGGEDGGAIRKEGRRMGQDYAKGRRTTMERTAEERSEIEDKKRQTISSNPFG